MEKISPLIKETLRLINKRKLWIIKKGTDKNLVYIIRPASQHVPEI